MWQSPHLSRRCKLLMFGVVSRGLPCDVCELEVSRALQREGLDAAKVVARVARARALRRPGIGVQEPHLELVGDHGDGHGVRR